MADTPEQILANTTLPSEADTDAAFNDAFRAPTAVAPAVTPDAGVATEVTPINMVNPEGKLVSIPSAQLTEALESGYQKATDEHVAHYEKEQKYGSAAQQLITGLEGAASAATFGLSTAGERALGVSPEDIRGRREENPISHGLGAAAGLAGSALLPGVGAANLMAKSAEGVALAAGLTGASTLAKVGSTAAKLAVENAMFQSGDELSKMISKDPNQTAQTAAIDIGLSGLIGGGLGAGFGAISPLWKATMGGKTGTVLQDLANKAGGIEGVIPDAMEDAITRSGMSLSPEVRASLSENPRVRAMFQTLQESNTKSGLEAQQALKTFKGQASDAAISTLGKTPDDVAALSNLSEYEVGHDLKKSLVNQLKEVNDPLSEQFTKIKERFKGTELPQAAKGDIATQIAELAQNEGYLLSPSAPSAKIVNRVLDELPNLKTLEDIRKYTSVIGDSTQDPALWRVGSNLKKIFRAAEENTLDRALGEQAPELVAQHAEARAAYKRSMDTIDALNDRLHVGKYSGPGSFMKALNDMSPEDVLRRLSPKGDAGIIGELGLKFPMVAEKLKSFHVDQILKTAAARAGEGETINSKVLFAQLDKMSPEMKSFILGADKGPQIDAIKSLIEALPAKMNNSGTAKTLDSLWSHVPESASAIAASLTGHNPVMGYVLGSIGKYVSRDVPDAIRLATLKFLGSDKTIEAEGFKTMVDYIHHTIQGENRLGTAVKNVFKAGASVLPQSQHPSASDRKKLDKQLKELQVNPNPNLNVGGKTSHYMPEHATALSFTTANAVQYLNSMRPNTDKAGPLDTTPVVPKSVQAEYDRVLNIAQQPLVIMSRIKDGSVTPSEVKALSTIYPAIYDKLKTKLMDQIIDQSTKERPIPYATRMALSVFMATPLDSSMNPANIQAAQAIYQPAGGPDQPADAPKQGAKHSMASLDKLPSQYMTQEQARAAGKHRS